MIEKENIPTVVSESVIEVLNGFQIRVYHLSNGKRVVNGEDLEKFFSEHAEEK